MKIKGTALNGFYLARADGIEHEVDGLTIIFINDDEVWYMGWDVCDDLQYAISRGLKILKKIEIDDL
jgi:hypothetical protein